MDNDNSQAGPALPAPATSPAATRANATALRPAQAAITDSPSTSSPKASLQLSQRRPWLARFGQDINLSYADLPVLACCTCSGLCDSAAFTAGGVFVSMQTGNTIFLALGAAHLPVGQSMLWLRSLASIAAFWLGCFFFSRAMRHLQPQRKSTLSLSFLVQSAFIFVAAALAETSVVPAFSHKLLGSSTGDEISPGEENNAIILLPLAFLAFQFGGQIVSSRILGFNEVPTNVLTSVYCDLLSDPKLFVPVSANPKRNRRFAAAVLLVVGGVCGGWLQRSRAGMSAALWIAGGIKFVLALAWMGWQGKHVTANEKGKGQA